MLFPGYLINFVFFPLTLDREGLDMENRFSKCRSSTPHRSEGWRFIGMAKSLKTTGFREVDS